MKLHTRIGLGLIFGAMVGSVCNAAFGDSEALAWVSRTVAYPIGQVFLRLLLMTVVPIVFTSIALGVAGVGDVRALGRLGGRTMAYFAGSTLLAAALGLLLVNTLRPGEGVDAATRDALMAQFADASVAQSGPADFGVATFVGIVPRNPVRAAADGDMLALIFFSLTFGVALTLIPRDKAGPVLAVLDGVGTAMISIIDLVMKVAPYGVFALVFVITSQFGWGILVQLGLYVAVVIVGLLLHGALAISAMVALLGRMNPVRFWKAVASPFVTAFSTSSSMATLPTSINAAERRLGVQPHIAGFVLPLGATMNMNGTALFEGVTVLFLAQVFGVELSLASQGVVLALSVLTAIGAAGVPGGSLPLMMLVMATVGVPPEGIAVILGVDRLLDMCRTTLNVCGDLSAAVYVDRVDRLNPGGGGVSVAAPGA